MSERWTTPSAAPQVTREDMEFALQVEILALDAHIRAYRQRMRRAHWVLGRPPGWYGRAQRACFAAQWLVLAHESLEGAEGVARRIGALLTMLMRDGAMVGPSAEAISELLDSERGMGG